MINDSHACIYQSRRIHNNPFIQSLFHSWTTTTTRKQQPQWQLTRYRTNRSAKHVAADELSHFAALAQDESEYWIHFVIDTLPYADKSNEANLPSHMRESMFVYSMNHFHLSFDCQRACIDCSFVLFFSLSVCSFFFREWKTHTVFYQPCQLNELVIRSRYTSTFGNACVLCGIRTWLMMLASNLWNRAS